MGTATRALTVTARTGDEGLALLDGHWDELLEQQLVPNPLLSSTWLQALADWRTGTPFVVVAAENGRLLAGAALELRHTGRLTPTVATWLGPADQLFSPDLLALEDRPDAACAVIETVLGCADVFSVGTSMEGAAAQAAAQAVPWRRQQSRDMLWVLPWPAPRLAYARKRSDYELRRARRRAEVEVRVSSGPREVDAALARLFRVHRDRWRDRPEETPRFATTARHRRWNRGVVAGLAARGEVRIAEVLEDGRPVAGCLGFVAGRGAVAHTWAVRPGGSVRQAGHVAVLACCDALAAAGAGVIDMGVTSGEPNSPKARLGALPHPYGSIFAASSRERQRRYEAMLAAVRTARQVWSRA